MTVRVLRADGWAVEHDADVPAELALAWRDGEPGVRTSPLGDVRVKPDTSSRMRWLGHRVLGRALRCQRALHLGPLLARAQVPCAPPLAALVHAATRSARLVSRDLPGRDLAATLADGQSSAWVPWDALADTVARLHRAGLRQRDLKAPNILLVEGGVALLDLDGIERVRTPAPLNARRADLGRLGASLLAALKEEDRAPRWTEFLRRYLETAEERAPTDAELAAWRAATEHRAAAKAARNRRRGRPLH